MPPLDIALKTLLCVFLDKFFVSENNIKPRIQLCQKMPEA